MAKVSRRSVLGGGLAALVLAGCGKTEWLSPPKATYDLPKPKPTSTTVTLTSARNRTNSRWATTSIDVSGGTPGRSDGPLVVADLLTGKQLWTFEAPEGDGDTGFALPKDTRLDWFSACTEGPRPLLLGQVLVEPCPDLEACRPYRGKISYGAGVLAVDGRTGKQRWFAQTVRPVDNTNQQDLKLWKDAKAEVIGGTSTGVLVSLSLGSGERTLCLDAETGKTMWTKDGVQPLFYSDACVVATSGGTGASGLSVLDFRTGKEITIRGLPLGADAITLPLANDNSNRYLRDDILVLQDPRSAKKWGVDLRRRLVVDGPERSEVVGRLADGRLLFAGLADTYGPDGTEEITWLQTQAEGEALPSAVRFEREDVLQQLQQVADGVIWTVGRAVDRAGRELAKPIPGLLFVTKTVAVSDTEVLRLAVTH